MKPDALEQWVSYCACFSHAAINDDAWNDTPKSWIECGPGTSMAQQIG
jgi:hypothetical protein